jgi:hypothetical protein
VTALPSARTLPPVRSRALVWFLLLAPGCGGDRRPSALTFDAATLDVARADASRPDVVPVDPCAPSPCAAEERCGVAPDGGMASGNGLDDDCDGFVDEGCACSPGEARVCFNGPIDRRGVGACRDGIARCTELAAWVGNECRETTVPAAEVCNGLDDDCDGATDNGLLSCATTLRCPASFGAAPLAEFTLDARTVDPMAESYAWEVGCPGGVSPCPAPVDAMSPTLRVAFPRAGIYPVTLRVRRAGREETCRFPVYVQGRGLRVELDWDRKGGIGAPGVDLDLHLAPMDARRVQSYRWFTPEDCYFQTCKAPGGTVRWAVDDADLRFAPSATAEGCASSPPPFGARWVTAGRCWNPRLDVDNIECDPTITDAQNPSFCFPENAAVDDPPSDVTFRLMVNFYRDHGTCSDGDARNDVVLPVLRVHCGGIERATLGSADDGVVPMRCADNPSVGSLNWSWLAGDVRFVDNACGVRDCAVRPLRATMGQFPRCEAVREEQDVCADALGRVFVRRAAARPVDADLGESR